MHRFVSYGFGCVPLRVSGVLSKLMGEVYGEGNQCPCLKMF